MTYWLLVTVRGGKDVAAFTDDDGRKRLLESESPDQRLLINTSHIVSILDDGGDAHITFAREALPERPTIELVRDEKRPTNLTRKSPSPLERPTVSVLVKESFGEVLSRLGMYDD